MIACNACQLLATNLPVCHSCLPQGSLGLLRAAMFGFFLMLVRLLFKCLLSYPFLYEVSGCLTSLRCRSHCKIRYIRHFDLLTFFLFFCCFFELRWTKFWLNLVGVLLILAHVIDMLRLRWMLRCYET